MPIEIKELVIRATVQDDIDNSNKKGKIDEKEKEELVLECVEQVLKIFKRKKDR